MTTVRPTFREFLMSFDPDQPRDEDGRWTSGGGGSSTDDVEVIDYSESEYTPTPNSYVVPDTSQHKVVRDGGLWGSSRANSTSMSGHAAAIMGIKGYQQFGDLGEKSDTAVRRFLEEIGNDKIGSEEHLFHGFQNTRNITFRVGDTFKLPLTATSGSKGDSVGYGQRLDRADQEGEPSVIAFPQGTPMVPYSKWKKDDAKDFGHVYSEALVAGEFRVVRVRKQLLPKPQHDTRPGKTWHPSTLVNVIDVEPIGTFDVGTGEWVKRG